MRIVHTESSCGWGGQEIRILSEAEGLRSRGHEVTLIACHGSRIYEEALRLGLTVQALPIERKSIAGVLAMRRWLKAHGADILNTHSSTDTWLTALACLALRDAPSIVRTRHISAAIPRDPATRWLYGRATRFIVTTGEALREQLARDNHIPNERMASVPTGIDSDRFTPGDRGSARRALHLPETLTLVGIVATLRSWKGHRFLIEAVAGLNRDDVGLVIVGDGPQRSALERQVSETGLRERIWMPGNQRDVLPWLRALDIFCLPSYANEGVPQALVQASLVALPSVTTAVGAIGEAAVHERTALIVQPQDANELARALTRLIDDPALRMRLGAAARDWCRHRFAYETMLARMEAIFRQVAGGRHGS